MNAVSMINLYCQKTKGQFKPPYYEILKKEGFDHKPNFKVSCTFDNNITFGEGSTLKIAKENATKEIVELLNIDHKLKAYENVVTFAIESYNAPLSEIWESGEGKEYILTLKKKTINKSTELGKEHEYRSFRVEIKDEII